MELLRSYAGVTLDCVQPSAWKQDYELRAAGVVIGTLKTPNIFARTTEAKTADGTWVIAEKGFFTSRFRITQGVDETVTAEFEMPRFGDGKIRLSPTRVLKFKRNFWKRQYSLTTDMNASLVTVTSEVSLLGQFKVKIDHRAENYEELPWLVLTLLSYAIRNRRTAGGG